MNDPINDRHQHRQLIDLLLEHLHQTTIERDAARQQLVDVATRAAEAIAAATQTIDQLKADHAHQISDLKTERDQLVTQLADAHHHLSPR